MRRRRSLTPKTDTNEHSDERSDTDPAKHFPQVADAPGQSGRVLQASGQRASNGASGLTLKCQRDPGPGHIRGTLPSQTARDGPN